MKPKESPVTCIYCRETKRGRFPREHVIPEAFGKFKRNLTLRCVCGDCNSYFSKEFDFFLARDSGEAILRLRHGVLPVKEARKLRHRRIRLTVNVPGPWMGAQVILIPDLSGKRFTTELVPQVGFRKEPEKEWIWLTEESLVSSHAMEQYRKGTEIKIAAPSSAIQERLLEKLKTLRIPFKKQGTLDQPVMDRGQITVQLEYQIDQVILRGVAKIACNYASYVRAAEFFLKSDFDELRKFVRYGELPPWKPVIPTDKPVLADDSHLWRQTSGHLVTFDWNVTHQNLVVQLALFNSITYLIRLCGRYSGLWLPNLGSGHHFDIDTMTVMPLTAAALIRPGR